MLAIRPEAIRAAALAAAIPYPPEKRQIRLGGGPAPVTTPFTEDARKVLGLTLREALKLGHGYMGAEHLLLALMSNREGVAGRVLAGLGADLDAARSFVGGIVEEHGPPAGLPAEWGEAKPPKRVDRGRRWRRQRPEQGW